MTYEDEAAEKMLKRLKELVYFSETSYALTLPTKDVSDIINILEEQRRMIDILKSKCERLERRYE